MTDLPYDADLVDTVATTLDLRTPNRDALDTLARSLDTATAGQLLVADLATGVGKTYVAGALLDYLYGLGVRNIVIVTPGSTIQRKTVANLTPGSPKYVRGLQCRPEVITLDDLETGRVAAAMDDDSLMKVFVFTVQSLLRPNSKDARRAHRDHETLGQSLSDYLTDADGLVVIADEHHIYAGNARRFAAAIAGLAPSAVIGLTATPDPTTPPEAIVYHYPLAAAIADGYVKIPVLVGRDDAVKDTRIQMADAVALLDAKVSVLTAWCAATGNTYINPVLFVVAQTIDEANQIRDTLAQPDLIGDPDAVLLITSEEPEASLEALDRLEHPDSPVRAVVSVSMLKEGWDVKNIYVIASVRAMESELLSEQVLGRGLRLPYGRRVGIPMLDTVEVLSHHTFAKLLDDAEVLLTQTLGERTDEAAKVAVSASAAAGRPTPVAQPVTDGLPGDPLRQVEVFLPGAAPAEPNQGTLFADDAAPADAHQVGGISALDARINEAARTAEALTHPEAPRAAGGVRLPWFLPSVRWRPVRERFSLTTINVLEVEAQGRRFADDNAPTLRRKALEAHRGTGGEIEVDIVDASADAPLAAAQLRLPFGSISEDLTLRLMRSNAVEQSVSEMRAAEAIAEAFLAGAGVTEETTWRTEHSRLATGALVEWLAVRQKAAKVSMVAEVELAKWPDSGARRLLTVAPTNRNKVTSSRQFARLHPYDGWAKSVYPSAAFDSWSAEFRLAVLMENSPQVKVWARIAADVPLSVPYVFGAASRTYNPDFISVDADGMAWVVEGKADGAMTDDVVLAKRDAAVAWVNEVNASVVVAQKWAYLLASENAIGNAADWTALLAASFTHK